MGVIFQWITNRTAVKIEERRNSKDRGNPRTSSKNSGCIDLDDLSESTYRRVTLSYDVYL